MDIRCRRFSRCSSSDVVLSEDVVLSAEVGVGVFGEVNKTGGTGVKVVVSCCDITLESNMGCVVCV